MTFVAFSQSPSSTDNSSSASQPIHLFPSPDPSTCRSFLASNYRQPTSSPLQCERTHPPPSSVFFPKKQHYPVQQYSSNPPREYHQSLISRCRIRQVLLHDGSQRRTGVGERQEGVRVPDRAGRRRVCGWSPCLGVLLSRGRKEVVGSCCITTVVCCINTVRHFTSWPTAVHSEKQYE